MAWPAAPPPRRLHPIEMGGYQASPRPPPRLMPLAQADPSSRARQSPRNMSPRNLKLLSDRLGDNYDDPLSMQNVIHAAKTKQVGIRMSLAEGSAQLTQNRLVQNKLYDQMVNLRQSFLREDQRITGTIPKYLLYSCLVSGGMPTSKAQAHETANRFMTGDGRFNWILFCEHIEKARSKSWSQASRIRSVKAFEEIDKDGSGRIDRDELIGALKRWKVNFDPETVEKLIATCDADGDGNISFPEFVDGLAANLVAPDTIYSAVNQSMPASPRGTQRSAHMSFRQAGGMFA
eukprot:CAMPEP_0174716202 /NCGR_PEP_ID=MMETSP1094-20130205/23263_1 /TAXON_ID=156173 /ORGANISM="Chrysochromulina brevifilum, Strain UTEX LB 985" /LENGTH=289 /DNA_ID=CAMNT_0015915893 /DNA_START=32 /DNA_END=901 /DNA_ORIENTATION=+